MNHSPLFLIRHSVLMAALVITTAGLTVQAAEPEHVGLTPMQRQQVQAVGHAILASRLHAKRSAESEAIRKQINQAKAQLEALMAPVPAGKITLVSPASSTGARVSSVSAAPMSARAKTQVWRHAHAAQLAGLDTALAHLKTRTGEVLSARTSAKPGFWQHLWAQVAGTPPARRQTIMTSLSDAALTRLGSLQSDVKAALALPEAERHQRLAALSEQLTIRKHFPMDISAKNASGQMRDTARADTPTLTSRTRHRHSF